MKLNQHTQHPSAFISSTFIDLKKERNAIAEVLERRGVNINALDQRPASNNSAKSAIEKGIETCDFVVLVIGDRFGSVLKNMTGSDTKSITMWEYDLAIHHKKPIIAYFKDCDSDEPISHDDRDAPDYQTNRATFSRFKSIVGTRHNPAYFVTSEELSRKIDKALVNVYRDGVIKLAEEKAHLSNLLSTMTNQIDALRTEVDALKRSTNPFESAKGLSLDFKNEKNPLMDGSFGLMDRLNKPQKG